MRLKEAPIEIVEALLNGLRDEARNGHGIRRLTAETLGQLGQKQVSSEIVAALLNTLKDKKTGVRQAAAESLARLGQITPEAIKVQIKILHNASYWLTRRNSARFLGKFGQSDEPTIQSLWHGLLDKNSNVRTTSTQALVQLARRFPSAAEIIEEKLVQAIQDPEFDRPDSVVKRSGHEYAYEGLWLMVVGGEVDGG